MNPHRPYLAASAPVGLARAGERGIGIMFPPFAPPALSLSGSCPAPGITKHAPSRANDIKTRARAAALLAMSQAGGGAAAARASIGELTRVEQARKRRRCVKRKPGQNKKMRRDYDSRRPVPLFSCQSFGQRIPVPFPTWQCVVASRPRATCSIAFCVFRIALSGCLSLSFVRQSP